jgi:uncharacterized membrane protein YheB (UPF0754 family)
MNKSVLTNLVAAGLVGAGLTLSGPAQPAVLNMGLFALAGGVTNWLAIHMLFEKVPGLYGSGVIVERFEDFKTGIHSLIMEQFFSQQNIERFFSELTDDQQHHLDFTDIIEQTDLEPTYTSLVESVMESSFGSMLGMFGGEAALEPLKEPFIAKMKNSLNDMAHSDSFQASVREKLSSGTVADDITQQIEHIVQSRLAELTPLMVKEIIQTMIREHLGWLVVWGGVFGGLIGLMTSFIIP